MIRLGIPFIENFGIRRVRYLSALNYSKSNENRPFINVSKSDVMVDEKVRISINGLHSNQKISLLSTLKENNKLFASCAHYVADDQGQVDTFVHHSHGGTFTGTQPMGLFTGVQGPFGLSRLIRLDVTTPFDVTLSLHDGHQDFESLAQEFAESRVAGLAVTSLRRWYMAPGVKRIPVEERSMYGSLLLPSGTMDYRAALLASHGFAAFSLAYIAYKDLPKHEKDLKISYFQ